MEVVLRADCALVLAPSCEPGVCGGGDDGGCGCIKEATDCCCCCCCWSCGPESGANIGMGEVLIRGTAGIGPDVLKDATLGALTVCCVWGGCCTAESAWLGCGPLELALGVLGSAG